jgi:hypothetical protein
MTPQGQAMAAMKPNMPPGMPPPKMAMGGSIEGMRRALARKAAGGTVKDYIHITERKL